MSESVVIVSGSRDWVDSKFVISKLEDACCTRVIQGGCPTGVDKIARDWAREKGIRCDTYIANWNRDGKAAGPIRNRRMLYDNKDNPAVTFIAFRLNKSPGTTSAIKIAKELKIDSRVYDR